MKDRDPGKGGKEQQDQRQILTTLNGHQYPGTVPFDFDLSDELINQYGQEIATRREQYPIINEALNNAATHKELRNLNRVPNTPEEAYDMLVDTTRRGEVDTWLPIQVSPYLIGQTKFPKDYRDPRDLKGESGGFYTYSVGGQMQESYRGLDASVRRVRLLSEYGNSSQENREVLTRALATYYFTRAAYHEQQAEVAKTNPNGLAPEVFTKYVKDKVRGEHQDMVRSFDIGRVYEAQSRPPTTPASPQKPRPVK